MINVVEPGYELLTSDFDYMMPLLERAARTCYKSEDKIGPGTADKLISKLLKLGHESVIEHVNITVKIICDRSCSHQLVRHRIASYSQVSQRYCDYSKLGLDVIYPSEKKILLSGVYKDIYPTIPRWERNNNSIKLLFSSITTPLEKANAFIWLESISNSYEAYLNLRKNGMKPEDARSVLPNATKTEVVTTFNLRQWRHVFKMRALNKHAQWQIRNIMKSILEDFSKKLPVIFEDLTRVLNPSS